MVVVRRVFALGEGGAAGEEAVHGDHVGRSGGRWMLLTNVPGAIQLENLGLKTTRAFFAHKIPLTNKKFKNR